MLLARRSQRELGSMRIRPYTRAMPTVQRIALAYNNVYAVRQGAEVLLIDTGPDYRGAGDTIKAAIDGPTPALTVATHGHLDHAGLGAWWQRRGVPVALHAWDAHFARGGQSSDEEFRQLACFVRECGAPPDVEAEALGSLEARFRWAREAANADSYRAAGRDARWPTGLRYEPFTPDLLFEGPSSELPHGGQFLHMPGHTPGNGVAWYAAEGWLFSGDQLLPEITPTPGIQAAHVPGRPWRFRSLPEFVASLRKARALGASRCYPGHGDPFDNVNEVIDANLAQVEQRNEKLLRLLRLNGARSLYAMAEELYPRALRRRFWQIISTVQGHLDILEDMHLASCTDGLWLAR